MKSLSNLYIAGTESDQRDFKRNDVWGRSCVFLLPLVHLLLQFHLLLQLQLPAKHVASQYSTRTATTKQQLGQFRSCAATAI